VGARGAVRQHAVPVLSPDGKRLVTFTPRPDASPVVKQGTLTVWDWRAGRATFRSIASAKLQSTLFSDGRRLLLRTEQVCYLHDAITGRRIAAVERDGRPGMDISSRHPRFGTVSDDAVELWDLDSGAAVATVYRGRIQLGSTDIRVGALDCFRQ